MDNTNKNVTQKTVVQEVSLSIVTEQGKNMILFKTMAI